MDNSKNIIADAFNKLSDGISEEHAHEFTLTKLEDVWKAVQDIDRSQRQRQSAQNMGRIKPLLQGIEKYSKVMEVLCNGTPYLPYVWAPIKLMVQFASQHYEVFESLLAAYAAIGAVLPRFDRYEKAFGEIPSFRVALATMYKHILDFHRRAYKLLSRKAWHVLFLSLWRDYKKRFSGIIEGLKEQQVFLDAEAMSIHISESKDARAQLQKEIQVNQKKSLATLEQSEAEARIARLQHSIAWLSVDDKTQEDNYERISDRRHNETCHWIANNGEFLSWRRDDGKNPVLWISGKPGAGKSVICSYILQLLGELRSQHHVCYYFCNSQESGNICSQILRTIALQLLRRNLDLASLIANQYVYQGASCGMAQLRILLPEMLETIDSTRIIIDGLDECSEVETQMSILKDLQRLLGKDVGCKIIISSRREVKIAEKLSGKPQIQLDGRKEVELDIGLYVKYEVGSIKTTDPEVRAKIESILVKKANGMFLWVRLVVGELRVCGSDWELEDRAKSLPRGLKKAYGRILDRIMDETHSNYPCLQAIKILEWIACSYRPLKTYELLDGIAFKVGCTELNSRTKMRKSVLDSCRPLIEESPSNTVDFVHFSAKEYILNEEYKQAASFISPDAANLNISFSCMAYLNTSLGLLPNTSTLQTRGTLILSGFHGLHLYANQFFAKHLLAYFASLAGSRSRPAPALMVELQKLLHFSKNSGDEGLVSHSTANLDVLSESPEVVSFLRKVVAFRDGLKQEEVSSNMLKSPKDVSLDSCSSDPTYFSDTRHTYQETVEALLSPRASDLFPGLDRRALDNFANIYGPAAYVCRYIHCSKATDGFDSPKKRDAHEAAHQRKFRCDDASCASFATGFTTRNALSRHNEKWHRVVTEFATLLILLPGNPSTRGRSQSSTPRFDRRISDQRSRSGLLSKKQTHKRSIEEGTTKAMKDADNRIQKFNELPSSEGWHNFAPVIPVMIQDSMAEAAPKVPIRHTPIAPLGDELSPEERAVLESFRNYPSDVPSPIAPSTGASLETKRRFQCQVSGCASTRKVWLHLDSFERHLGRTHAIDPRSDYFHNMIQRAEYAALNTAETGEENETMIENATQESPGQQGESDIGLDHGLFGRHISNSLSERRGNNLPNPSPDVMIEHRNQPMAGNTPINLRNLMEITGGTNIAASLAIGDVALRTHQSLPHLGPTVGEKLDIQSQPEYLGDSALEYLQALPEPILSFRPVSNKGDSTWLIPIFCYFESLASFPSSAGLIIKGEVERIGNISLTLGLCTEYIYSPYEQSAFDSSKKLVICILRGLPQLRLEDCFNNATDSNTLAQFAKLLASRNISAGPMGCLDLELLTLRLFHPAGIGCTVISNNLDGIPWQRFGHGLTTPPFSNISYLPPARSVNQSHLPMVYILDRSGHYDILYADQPYSSPGDAYIHSGSARLRLQPHELTVKKWICSEDSASRAHFQPLVPLSGCSVCSSHRKYQFDTAEAAANHLTHIHFNPKTVPYPPMNAELMRWQGQEPSISELIENWVQEVQMGGKHGAEKEIEDLYSADSQQPWILPTDQPEDVRKQVIHYLAVEPLSQLSLQLKGLPAISHDDLIYFLKGVVTLRFGGVWEMQQQSWKELDVWAFDYDTFDDRQRAIDNAIKQYDMMGLPISDPVWERLLKPDERGRGKCLSKLLAAKGAIEDERSPDCGGSSENAATIWTGVSRSSSTDVVVNEHLNRTFRQTN